MSQQNGSVSKSLMREVSLPKEVIALIKATGAKIPDYIKEIETQVETDESITKIMLPPNMDKLTAAKELENQYKNEENLSKNICTFDGFYFYDSLVAIRRVTEEAFGWMNGQPGLFGGAPTAIDIVVDVVNGQRITEKGFYGKFVITGWENAECNISITDSGEAALFVTAKKKYEKVITNYFNLIREQLNTNSIYKGRSIQVSAGGMGGLNYEIIENKGSDMIVLNHDENLVLEQFILPSIGKKGKRCYLFAGGYGNGKTETAMRVGRAAGKKGVGFFYLKDSGLFEKLLETSKKYAPCVVFMEDIDEIAGTEDRDARMNSILNTLDGFATKGNDINVIFTTNHAHRIASALKRPGRIDHMINFENPNKETKSKIFRKYFEKLNGGSDIDYDFLAERTPDVSGAVVAEIAKRAVMIVDQSGEKISSDIVESSILSMKFQIEIMSSKKKSLNKEKIFFKLFFELLFERGNTDDSDIWSGFDNDEHEEYED